MLELHISGDRRSGKTQALAICVAALVNAGYSIRHFHNDAKPYEEYFHGLVEDIAAGRKLPQDHRDIHVRETDAPFTGEGLPLDAQPLRDVDPIVTSVAGEVEATTVPAGSDLILAAIAMGRDVDISIRKPVP